MKSVTPNQTKDFNGSWKFDDEKNKPILKAFCKEINISQNENELRYEIISSRNEKEEIISKHYNFGDQETIENVKNSLENSVMKTNLEFQGDGKLLINSVRTLNDGVETGRIIYKMTWELMDGGKILKVSNTASMPDKSEFPETPELTVYYSKV